MKCTFYFLLRVLACIILLSGCGSNSTSSAGSSASNGVLPANAVTIDNAGSVPIFGGGSTSSVIYVHNNTDKKISGITYSATMNVPGHEFLNPAGMLLCATIEAHQSCPLQFKTPVLSEHETQGSATITLSYNVDNESGVSKNQSGASQNHFSQIISFQQVFDSQPGVYFDSGVNVSGFGNSNGYATVYMYGGGNDEIYTVTGITNSAPSVTISNGNITGQQIASNFVQAVEITSPITEQEVFSTLTISSLNTSMQNFINAVSTNISPVTSGAIIIAGQVPVINTSESSTPTGSLTFLNSGNGAATLGTSSSSTGITNLSGCTSGGTLAVGSTCTITFNVTQSGGSGTITLNYTGASSSTSVSQTVTWYNSTNGALVNMSYNNPVNFVQSNPQTTPVTVTNIGGYNLTGTSIPNPSTLSGSATATVSYPGTGYCGESSTLNIGQSCIYNLVINDSSVDTNGQLLFGFSGSYNNGSSQTYNRYSILTYSTIALSPNLVITPNPASSMTIQGNNTESTSQVLTVSNSGNATANLTSQTISSSYFSITSCPSTIESGATCSTTVTLKPTSGSTSNITGTATYTIAYNGGESYSLTSTDQVPYTITPDLQGITLSTPVATNATSGSGTSSSPFVFNGYVTTQAVTLTLTNSGSNTIQITGIQDTNSHIPWNLSLTGSTCVQSPTILAGNSCTIVYNNVLNSNILALGNVGSSYTENITIPTIIFKDTVATGNQFSVQPNLPNGTTTVNATASMATVANTVTLTNGGTANPTINVKNVLTNGTSYVPITVTSNMENYFTGTGTSSSGCSSSIESAVMVQVCTLTGTTDTESTTYTVESGFIKNQTTNLSTIFTINPASQIVSMGTTYLITTIPQY